MGGLISRYYISQVMQNNSEDGRPRVSHLVMLGTPNLGSPCADVMNVAFEMLGKNVEAVRQLRQDQVANFNTVNKLRKGVKFSALAGNPLPTMCKEVVWNDGVVPVASAKWIVADTAESKSLHTDLTGTKDFSDFVKPRIAVGPKGNHNPDVPTSGDTVGYAAAFDNANASLRVPRMYGMQQYPGLIFEDTPAAQPFAKSVVLQPKQSVEVEIPVAAARNLGITLMAASVVSATLFNEKGIEIGKNLAGSPEAGQLFRSIYVDNGVAAGTWKIRLENRGDREMEAVLTTWFDAGR
jgi:hypothetical protein